jgi:hypothetical protein
MICTCRENIEKLRKEMTEAYDHVYSFIDASVLTASEALDDALVEYRKCPNFESCNTERWRQVKKDTSRNSNDDVKIIAI